MSSKHLLAEKRKCAAQYLLKTENLQGERFSPRRGNQQRARGTSGARKHSPAANLERTPLGNLIGEKGYFQSMLFLKDTPEREPSQNAPTAGAWD